MFSYYGSKGNTAHLYPAPKFDLIIEPFAGSARYALRYYNRDVILVDKFRVVIDVWKFLQQASEKDILGLPNTENGCDLRDFNLSDAERYFLYFISTGGGAASTGFKVRARSKNHTFNNCENSKRSIAKQLFKIRHWKFVHGEYYSIDAKATWFVDPPYFKGGHKYKLGKTFDYSKLEAWIKNLKGQIIVCENSSATWMPFIPIAKNNGIKNTKTTEVFWTNDAIQKQVSLFN